MSPRGAVREHAVRGMVLGGYWGRAIPGTTQPLSPAARQRPQGAGPACWVVWKQAGRPLGVLYWGRRRDGPGYHPSGPVGPAPVLALPVPRTSRIAASWPIRAELQSFQYKVSQNSRVSPKKYQKACHSPYIQNGLQKSALGILRFPLLAAFSHKELMVPF